MFLNKDLKLVNRLKSVTSKWKSNPAAEFKSKINTSIIRTLYQTNLGVSLKKGSIHKRRHAIRVVFVCNRPWVV